MDNDRRSTAPDSNRETGRTDTPRTDTPRSDTAGDINRTMPPTTPETARGTAAREGSGPEIDRGGTTPPTGLGRPPADGGSGGAPFAAGETPFAPDGSTAGSMGASTSDGEAGMTGSNAGPAAGTTGDMNATTRPMSASAAPAGTPTPNPAASTGTTAPRDGDMEGASGLGSGAERPGAVSAGFPRTVAHTGPAPEEETGRYHGTAGPGTEAARPDVTTPNMAASPTPSYDRAGATSTGSTSAAASNMAAASTGIGGTRWMTWGLVALAVLVLLWIVF